MRNRALLLLLLLLAAAVLVAPTALAVNIDWVYVGDPGNPADTPSTSCYAADCGSVSYDYFISKYEVTNAQYAEFLNAKAASDPLGLYNTSMESYGITQSGMSGSFSYSVTTGFADKPVVYVSFYDALRFSNWLNNGQGSGDTETGAYTLLGGTASPSNGATVTRNDGASIFLESENEWYKAAYYDAVSTSYFDYPTGTDIQPACVAPGSDTGNSANCGSVVGAPVDVGSYPLSGSPYGTYDQGGNVWEWNEQFSSGRRSFRGGSWGSSAMNLIATIPNGFNPVLESQFVGFRVAQIPEPSTGLLVMTGLLGFAYRQRRHRRTARSRCSMLFTN